MKSTQQCWPKHMYILTASWIPLQCGITTINQSLPPSLIGCLYAMHELLISSLRTITVMDIFTLNDTRLHREFIVYCHQSLTALFHDWYLQFQPCTSEQALNFQKIFVKHDDNFALKHWKLSFQYVCSVLAMNMFVNINAIFQCPLHRIITDSNIEIWNAVTVSTIM
jgi:hypothetical protein